MVRSFSDTITVIDEVKQSQEVRLPTHNTATLFTHRSNATLAAMLRDYDDALAYVCMHVGCKASAVLTPPGPSYIGGLCCGKARLRVEASRWNGAIGHGSFVFSGAPGGLESTPCTTTRGRSVTL